MTSIEVEIDDKQFRDLLRNIEKKVDGVIHKEVLNAAEAVCNRARAFAPKKYGFLRASIGKVDMSQISISNQRKQKDLKRLVDRGLESASVLAPTFNGIWRESRRDVTVGSDLKYAWTQEHNIFAHETGQSPFLDPAVYYVKYRFAKRLEEVLEDLLG